MALKTPLIVDIETDGQAPQTGRLLAVGFQLADKPEALVLSAIPDYIGWDEAMDALREMLADPERPIVSHTKYDARYLRLQGWEVSGPFYDTQVMAWVINENQFLSLDSLAQRYCGIKMDKRIKRVNGAPVFVTDATKYIPLTRMLDPETEFEVWHRDEKPPFQQLLAYCARDVEATTQLFNTLWARLEDTAWLDYYLDEEVPFTGALLDAETAGLPVNLNDSETLRARLEVEAEAASSSLLASGSLPPGFNLNSGDQLASYLYEKVATLKATLRYDKWTCEALQSCLDGEHEDCELYSYLPEDSDAFYTEASGVARHVVDLLPEGFALDKVGRTSVHGWYTFKGRAIPPTAKTDSGSRSSTSSPVLKSNLAALGDEWVLELLQYRKVEKVLTTYLRRFPELAQRTGSCGGSVHNHDLDPACGEGTRLYGRFNQTGTKTGRLSSSEPNLQNIPAHGPLGEAVRGLFQGDLVVGDYSQLEPRLLAHFTQDPVLLDVYRSGKDIYNVTGTAVFGMPVEKGMPERDIAKVVFLGDQYGMGPDKLAATLTMNGFVTTPDTAKGYQRELHGLYRVAEQWKSEVRSSVKRKGYVVTIGGRHRRLKAAFEDRRNWKNVGYGERQAVNAIIQGSAGDVVRRVMCAEGWQHEQRLLAQVHDELVWEWLAHYAPSDEQLAYIGHLGETAHGFNLTVPLKFEPHFGHSWFAAKEGLELPDEAEETQGFDED